MFVVSARNSRLTRKEAVAALRHNLRERTLCARFEKPSVIKNRIHKDRTADNVILYSQYEGVYVPFGTPGTKRQVEKYVDTREQDIVEHYESQLDSKGRKKKYKKNFCAFEEFIITFGSDRVRQSEKDSPLSDQEVQALRAMPKEQYIECAQKFLEHLRGKGYRNFILAFHLDEKSPHFHIVAETYSQESGFVVRGGIDGGRAKDGIELQDAVAECFSPMGFIRGERGGKTAHVPLQKLHQLDYREQALKLKELELEEKSQHLLRWEQELTDKEENLHRLEQELDEYAKDTGFYLDEKISTKNPKIQSDAELKNAKISSEIFHSF
jgi:hypothetical protein